MGTPPVLPLSKFVDKARDLFAAFLFLEENNGAHRDAKLDNVLVKEDGCLCVCDLGEAIRFVGSVVPCDTPLID